MAAPCLSSAVVGTGRRGVAMQAERVPAWNQSSGTRTKTQEQGQKTKFTGNVQATDDGLLESVFGSGSLKAVAMQISDLI